MVCLKTLSRGIVRWLAVLAFVPAAIALTCLSRAGALGTGLHLLRYFPAASAVGGGVAYPLLRWAVARFGLQGGWVRIGQYSRAASGWANCFSWVFWGGVFIALTGYGVVAGGLMLGMLLPLGLLLLAAGLSAAFFCLYAQDGDFNWRPEPTGPPTIAEGGSLGAAGATWLVTARPLWHPPLFGARGSGGGRTERGAMAASVGLGFLPLVTFLMAWLILVPPAGLALPEARSVASGTDVVNVFIALAAVRLAPRRAGVGSAIGWVRAPRNALMMAAIVFTAVTAATGGLPWVVLAAGVLAVFFLAEAWIIASLLNKWKLPPLGGV